MAKTNSLEQQIKDLLVTRNVHPVMRSASGQPTEDVQNAKTMEFEYVGPTGQNYGTMVIVFDVDHDMKVLYGDNLGRTMEGDDKNEFYAFLQQLNRKAKGNHWTYTITDIGQLKHIQQGLAAIREGLFEGYYGTKTISYSGRPTEARLTIYHKRPLGENDARYRLIDRMFIETVDGERFRLGFRSLAGGKAMLEHVRQGGKPYDIRGNHITEMVNEIAVLSRFHRANATRILEGVTQSLVTEAQVYYDATRENLRSLATARGYQKYFESWHPATITEQDDVVNNIKTLFIEQTIDARIEAALPLLAKIQQRQETTAEAEIFEEWVNTASESEPLPEPSPEQISNLQTLMSKPLIVGADGVDASEQLVGIFYDRPLLDRIEQLADESQGKANAWDDSQVQQRMTELGVPILKQQTPPAAAVPAAQEPAVAEDMTATVDQVGDAFKKGAEAQVDGKIPIGMSFTETEESMGATVAGGMAPVMDEGDNLATFVGPNEGRDDPMNYNAAMTGSYYESANTQHDIARLKQLSGQSKLHA